MEINKKTIDNPFVNPALKAAYERFRKRSPESLIPIYVEADSYNIMGMDFEAPLDEKDFIDLSEKISIARLYLHRGFKNHARVKDILDLKCFAHWTTLEIGEWNDSDWTPLSGLRHEISFKLKKFYTPKEPFTRLKDPTVDRPPSFTLKMIFTGHSWEDEQPIDLRNFQGFKTLDLSFSDAKILSGELQIPEGISHLNITSEHNLVLPTQRLKLTDWTSYIIFTKVDLTMSQGHEHPWVSGIVLDLTKGHPDFEALRITFPQCESFYYIPPTMSLKNLKKIISSAGNLQNLSVNLEHIKCNKEDMENLMEAKGNLKSLSLKKSVARYLNHYLDTTNGWMVVDSTPDESGPEYHY